MTERTPTHEKTVKQLWDGETVAMPNCRVKNKRGRVGVLVQHSHQEYHVSDKT